MNSSARILIVDDEVHVRFTMGALLQRAGYVTVLAENGEEAVSQLERQWFDLLLVDLKMPGMDGMEVVAAAQQRQPDIVVIVLTGHGSLETVIEGIQYHIFDYILKTADPSHVLERVHAGLATRSQQLRRTTLLDMVGVAVEELHQVMPNTLSVADMPISQHDIIVGALRLDPWRQQATLHGRLLTLTPTEFRLLCYMAEHVGTALPYSQLVQHAQGYEISDPEACELIKPHIHHLRQKIEPDPTRPQYIRNVRGQGYLLDPIEN